MNSELTASGAFYPVQFVIDACDKLKKDICATRENKIKEAKEFIEKDKLKKRTWFDKILMDDVCIQNMYNNQLYFASKYGNISEIKLNQIKNAALFANNNEIFLTITDFALIKKYYKMEE